MKTALITGSTDGIGKALAISLAKKRYTIHVLGINENKGKEVLDKLNRINEKGNHKLFLVDLSTKKANEEFIKMYNSKFVQLDLLVLNANAMFKSPRINDDGIDTGFMIGYMSRYMFSVGFDQLLKSTEDSRLIHIGGATLSKPIKFDKLSSPDYKGSDSTYMGFMANNLLVQYANKKGLTDVPYEFMEPGIVNTNTVKSQNFAVRLISKVLGMIEPEESGERIAHYILNSKPDAGAFFSLGKKKQPKKSVLNGEKEFDKLMKLSTSFTHLDYK